MFAGLESLDALEKLPPLSLEVKDRALEAVHLLLVILGYLLGSSDLISLLFRHAVIIHDGISEVVDVNVVVAT